MKTLIIMASLGLSALAFANPIERGNLSPTEDQAEIPGTEVPISKMNTSPTPTPIENESEKFRGTLKASPDAKIQYQEEDIWKDDPDVKED